MKEFERDVTINETVFFLMDHTTKNMTQIATAIQSLEYQKPILSSAEETLRELTKIFNEEDDFEEVIEKAEAIGVSYDTILDTCGLFTDGENFDSLVVEDYNKNKAAHDAVDEIFAIFGGKENLKEIVDFALSIATRDYEFVYSTLRNRYSSAPWYI